MQVRSFKRSEVIHLGRTLTAKRSDRVGFAGEHDSIVSAVSPLNTVPWSLDIPVIKREVVYSERLTYFAQIL